ncbi:ribosome maturation factor RimP [Adlercreutzia aquisgranensis]|uniref:Ribosome maturation factor RimP n=1 Tax=Muribaculaceae bacterium Z82 TaxID=2304548 RepID=A0A7C9JEH0_9BACT|nr:ribosome maturation factor RimP [Adlercreutzia aquisgranensis]
MLTAKEQQILDALEGRAQQEGVEVVTVEVVGSKHAPIIRVYIDTEEGVSFDQLASAQAWINQIMDRLDPFPGAYTLEVSSPGIDRPLRTSEHFAAAVGQAVAVKTVGPIDGRSSWTGTVSAVEGDVVVLQVDDALVQIPFDNVKKAHVKGIVDFSG